MNEAREAAYRYIGDILSNHDLGSEWSMDKLDVIRADVQARFSDEDQIILSAYESIEREFIKGHRCSVCGRTEAQNLAIGYDCTHEC